MKKTLSAIMALSIIVLICFSGCKSDAVQYVSRDDWADDVKANINMLIADYGKDSKNYDDTAYAVFDFDNTSSIFDLEDQLAMYQLMHMAFEIKPENMKDILLTDLKNPDEDLTDFGYGKGSYNDWVNDINKAYSYLYQTYGPFSAKGLDEEKAAEIQKDPQWCEFTAKMRTLYDLIDDKDSASVAYPWVLYWFAGMTEQQVYDLAYASHTYYSKVETSETTLTTPENIQSKTGVVTYTWTNGIQVSENIKELMKALNDNGIKVWICSASLTNVIRAGIDVWGLHDSVTGVLAMTNKVGKDGLYINEYDYENGCGWLCNDNGEWVKDNLPTKAQPFAKGKVTAIENALVPKYGHGPIAGFMDSTGDYNFCTEFKTLKLVTCFNRANRKVTDGGGVIAELAMYQRDTLGYDLRKANKAGDTMYVLQGRDENGMRTFRNSNKTLILGEKEEKLFKNEDNEKQLQYMIDNKMSTEDIINTFCIKTAADAPENKLGFKYGFCTEFAGYHSHE